MNFKNSSFRAISLLELFENMANFYPTLLDFWTIRVRQQRQLSSVNAISLLRFFFIHDRPDRPIRSPVAAFGLICLGVIFLKFLIKKKKKFRRNSEFRKVNCELEL